MSIFLLGKEMPIRICVCVYKKVGTTEFTHRHSNPAIKTKKENMAISSCHSKSPVRLSPRQSVKDSIV